MPTYLACDVSAPHLAHSIVLALRGTNSIKHQTQDGDKHRQNKHAYIYACLGVHCVACVRAARTDTMVHVRDASSLLSMSRARLTLTGT